MKRKMTALLGIFLFLIAAVSVTLADANREIRFDQDTYIVYIGKPGKITAVSTDPSVSQKAVCSIKNVQAVTDIALSQTEATVAVSKSVTLKAAVSPSNAGDKGIDWSSSDESVATVSSGDAVKGVGKGNAVITATAKDGSGIIAACPRNNVICSFPDLMSFILSKRDMFKVQQFRLMPEWVLCS